MIKIGILGSRGVPNQYGGFEQFAEHLSKGLADLGAGVWVYCSDDHPYGGETWKGVNLIHCHDPENTVGALGQFIYDFNCIRDSRKRDFDIILQLGYTSNSVWYRLLPAKPVIITNMDGMEWKRSKYSRPVRRFLKYAEKLAVKSSHRLVADSVAIKKYLDDKYAVDAVFIPYGADIPGNPRTALLRKFNVEPFGYYLLIARLQPDNHIEEIIKGVVQSTSGLPLLVVGKIRNKFGKYLLKKYKSEQVTFAGAVFDKSLLDALRYYARLYFHGHSAGGTNPSLLEAMAAQAVICAHDNPFNRAVLNSDAVYFKAASDVSRIINSNFGKPGAKKLIASNLKKIKNQYSWPGIINDYWELFNRELKRRSPSGRAEEKSG
jgi:glycosyltransferase involved in cell wall biosynthesis